MYEGKRLFISVGALQAQGVRDQLRTGYTVIAYEPEKAAFERYQEIKDDNFVCHNKAVSDFEGRAILRVSAGASTILDTSSNELYPESYEVDVVTLDSVLDPIKSVHVLYLNCEGSEIAIIMGTSLDNLAKCRRIHVEFHGLGHYPRLCIADEAIRACVRRLGQRFKIKDRHTYHPYYEFLRKGQS